MIAACATWPFAAQPLRVAVEDALQRRRQAQKNDDGLRMGTAAAPSSSSSQLPADAGADAMDAWLSARLAQHDTVSTRVVVHASALVEADPTVHSVGNHSWPNRDGVLQLDAAVIELRESEAAPSDKKESVEGNAEARHGAVMCVEGLTVGAMHAAAIVARHCRHTNLCGAGAVDFCLGIDPNFFVGAPAFVPPPGATGEGVAAPAVVPLTTDAVQHNATSVSEILLGPPGHGNPKPITTVATGESGPRRSRDDAAEHGTKSTNSGRQHPNHDTVGIIAYDGALRTMTVGCSTSGLKGKLPGRVGDSPIMGSGLYGECRVGAAVATGDGDVIATFPLCFVVVQTMRNHPDWTVDRCCENAIAEMLRLPQCHGRDVHVGIVAMRWGGERVGGACSRNWGDEYRFSTYNASTKA